MITPGRCRLCGEELEDNLKGVELCFSCETDREAEAGGDAELDDLREFDDLEDDLEEEDLKNLDGETLEYEED